MNQFLLHFFPLLTIFLFCMAGVLVILYYNAVHRIEKHIASTRPLEWEAMGKPSIFSGKYSEDNEKFREFVESGEARDGRDMQMIILLERSKRMKKLLAGTTWSAFAMYVFTIAAVRFLMHHVQGG